MDFQLLSVKSVLEGSGFFQKHNVLFYFSCFSMGRRKVLSFFGDLKYIFMIFALMSIKPIYI